MKRILIVTLVIMLAVLSGCTSALSHGAESSDATHKFLLHIGQVTDQVNTEFPDEGEVFLIIKYGLTALSVLIIVLVKENLITRYRIGTGILLHVFAAFFGSVVIWEFYLLSI